MDLRRGINLAVDHVVTVLKSRAKMISTTEEIAQVGGRDWGAGSCTGVVRRWQACRAVLWVGAWAVARGTAGVWRAQTAVLQGCGVHPGDGACIGLRCECAQPVSWRQARAGQGSRSACMCVAQRCTPTV